MFDLTTVSGIVRLIAAFFTIVGTLYSLCQFVIWQYRYCKGGGKHGQIPPFGIVGAVILGALIVGAIGYFVFIFGLKSLVEGVSISFQSGN